MRNTAQRQTNATPTSNHKITEQLTRKTNKEEEQIFLLSEGQPGQELQ